MQIQESQPSNLIETFIVKHPKHTVYIRKEGQRKGQ